MKTEMRQKLAREPFEEKIRKVAQLIRLAKAFPRRPRQRPSTSSGRLVTRKGRVAWTGKLPKGVNSANAVDALHDEI
jgi:hypothetical protein